MRLGRERPGFKLVAADIAAVGEDRERHRARAGWWIERRFKPDRPRRRLGSEPSDDESTRVRLAM
jgi:hypothetical protein